MPRKRISSSRVCRGSEHAPRATRGRPPARCSIRRSGGRGCLHERACLSTAASPRMRARGWQSSRGRTRSNGPPPGPRRAYASLGRRCTSSSAPPPAAARRPAPCRRRRRLGRGRRTFRRRRRGGTCRDRRGPAGGRGRCTRSFHPPWRASALPRGCPRVIGKSQTRRCTSACAATRNRHRCAADGRGASAVRWPAAGVAMEAASAVTERLRASGQRSARCHVWVPLWCALLSASWARWSP